MLIAAVRRQPAPRTAKPAHAGGAAVPTGAVFTIDVLAIYLKLPKWTLCKLAQEGTIPGHKVGKHWRFRRDTIDRWLDRTAPKSARKRRANGNT